MIPILWTTTSVTFLVLLAYAVEQLSDTYTPKYEAGAKYQQKLNDLAYPDE